MSTATKDTAPSDAASVGGVQEIQPESIDDLLNGESASDMLTRLKQAHSGQQSPADRALASVSPIAPEAPEAPKGKVAKPAPEPHANANKRPAKTPPKPTLAPTATPCRALVNIPASVYDKTKTAAKNAGINLTQFALEAMNRHANDLASAFGDAREVVDGPIPMTQRPRQRRDVGETLMPMQLYLTEDQRLAIDKLVVSVNAGSRSALVTEALRREVD